MKNNFLDKDNLYGWFELEPDARIGNISKANYQIYIKGRAGNIPHMYIYGRENNIIMQIELTKNKYFREDNDAFDTLNEKERKALNTYLNETISGLSNWEYLIHTWNIHNPDHMVDLKNTKKPDYTVIDDDKLIMTKVVEDVHSEEYLTEMAQVTPDSDYKYLFAVTPDMNRIGNPYFKVYDAEEYGKAKKVARFSFKDAFLITGHKERNGKKEWNISDISKSDITEIIRCLNEPSAMNSNITVWDNLKFEYNRCFGFRRNVIKYVSGEMDTSESLENPDYLPSSLKIPNYLNLMTDKEFKKKMK